MLSIDKFREINHTGLMKFLKNAFKKENLFYTIILFFTIALVTANRAVNGFSDIIWIADFGTLFGVFYSVAISQHKWIAYPLNIISTSFIAAVNLIQQVWFGGFFAACISLPLVISGMFRWKKNEKTDQTKNLKKLSKKHYIIISVTSAFLLAGITVAL